MEKIVTVEGKINADKLVLCVLFSEGIGFLSSAFSKGYLSLYGKLLLPGFAPPAWVFSPVWTILYFLMGLASYRIWMGAPSNPYRKLALFYFCVQLGLNFLWSILFFRFQWRGAAFIEILMLLLFILLATGKFYKIDKMATYFMLPYVAWVSFASLLNFSIWKLNQ